MKKCMGCMEEYEEKLDVCPHCGYIEGTQPAEIYHMVPGSILAGKYIVGKTLGYGGFGVTYVGYDAELERKVAIKEYLPGEFSTRIPGQTQVTVYEGEGREQFQAGIEKFMDEAKRLAKFQDTAGIVHIYDSFFENDTAYIVMEYIEGETLREKLDRDGKMSVEEALEFILPVLSALKEVHAAGILHRDIAPDNIMLDKDGQARLIDFGASRFATTTHSKSLSVLIKPGYAPVEQYQSRGNQGPWTDVYALAATFYTMLTGQAPKDSMERMGRDDLKVLSKAGAKVSKNIDTAVQNAMNLKVEERTPSVETFEKELLSEEEVARLVVKKDKKDVGKWPVWVKTSIGAATAAVACFIILLLTGVISFAGGKLTGFVLVVGKTIVPNMVNVTIDMAENEAENHNLEIQIVGKVYSDEIPEGYVLAQNIAAGSKVEEGSVLELTISAGVEMIFMPSVEGLSREAAIALLEEQELQYRIEEVESMTAPGSIVSQSVAAEEKIAKGTEILLQVSAGIKGLDSSVEVQMPDLKGMDYTEARKALAELGLYIGKESEVYDNFVKKGGIVYQSIPAGNILHQGDIVSVQVSIGKEQARVPDVWLEDEESARQLLAAAGLIAEVSYESSATVSKGLVISQGIEKDTLVDIGTKVKIVVSTGKEEPKEEPKEPEKEQIKEWSGWMESLPAGVTADKYEIETRTQYAYRTLSLLEKTGETTDKSMLDNAGYDLVTATPQYSQWSDWSENVVAPSDMVEVQTKQQWSGRNYIYAEPTTSGNMEGWECYNTTATTSNWSEWSTVYPGDLAGREIQTDTRVTGYKTQVLLARYFYNGLIYTSKPSDNAIFDEKWFDEGSWTSSFPWSDGTPTYRFNGNDYFDLSGYKTQQVPTGYQNWYSYRDTITTYYYRTWGEWSNWSDQNLGGDDVRSRTLYSYRNVSYVYTYRYTYSQWSDWSAYGDAAVSPSDTTEVRTKTLYRYKEK